MYYVLSPPCRLHLGATQHTYYNYVNSIHDIRLGVSLVNELHYY